MSLNICNTSYIGYQNDQTKKRRKEKVRIKYIDFCYFSTNPKMRKTQERSFWHHNNFSGSKHVFHLNICIYNINTFERKVTKETICSNMLSLVILIYSTWNFALQYLNVGKSSQPFQRVMFKIYCKLLQ